MQPAVAQAVEKQRAGQAVLEAAGGVGGLVFQVQVNAVAGKGGQGQGDQVRVSAALVIGLDAGDGRVEPVFQNDWMCGV
ncbi:MAG: hypothetical protein ACD_23C01243G0001 [uncultured bacterium]|nr:MAG: hypothetical protein ACD_23C01243G0001 [uncultured bacterium]